jgi:hypothetical protein
MRLYQRRSHRFPAEPLENNAGSVGDPVIPMGEIDRKMLLIIGAWGCYHPTE